jgi:serine/threonine-protein kinase
MELAEEGSLCNLVDNSGPRTLEEIAPQIELLLEGLGAAHSVGIIHRDIKPENVLIDRYHRWRLTDFGIANITGEAKSMGGGTPAFAAPEQLLNETQGPGTDLFSLAAIVAYALTGQPPFGDADTRTILARQLSSGFDDSVFPAPIGGWLRRAFNTDPDKRFEDAVEMKAGWCAAVEAVKSMESRPGFLTKLFHRNS